MQKGRVEIGAWGSGGVGGEVQASCPAAVMTGVSRYGRLEFIESMYSSTAIAVASCMADNCACLAL